MKSLIAALLVTASVAVPALAKDAHKAKPVPAKPSVVASTCISPQKFDETLSAKAGGPVPHYALTGETLRAYIDGFNHVSESKQDYDTFDRLELYHDDQRVGWAFFKNGCFLNFVKVDPALNEAIMKVMAGGSDKKDDSI